MYLHKSEICLKVADMMRNESVIGPPTLHSQHKGVAGNVKNRTEYM